MTSCGLSSPGTKSGCTQDMNRAGRSTSDICAVGAYRDAHENPRALIFHYDGSSWQELAIDADVFLWDTWPADAGAYFVVGPDDTLATVQP